MKGFRFALLATFGFVLIGFLLSDLPHFMGWLYTDFPGPGGRKVGVVVSPWEIVAKVLILVNLGLGYAYLGRSFRSGSDRTEVRSPNAG